MRLPEIQTEIEGLAQDARLPGDIAERLRELAGHMRRRSPKARAAPRSRRMTPALRAEVRAYAAAHPGLRQMDIGLHFNINAGRVSEALRGLRT